jgi:hypothetical protein
MTTRVGCVIAVREALSTMIGRLLWGARTSLLGLLLFGTVARAETASPSVDFDRQVRPILSNHCFQCHGPDANERQAELRLDIRDEAIRPAESGKPAIVPGKASDSTLVRRVMSKDRRFVMPPPKANKPLSEEQKAILSRWIEQGASYQAHWSFTTPRRPPLPLPRDAARARNAIDRFIVARLEAEGMHLAPEADRATLIRRVTLDLTGLPPTLAEVDAFLADAGPDAYDRLVDRLLASKHHGERMALDWLDAARFADTHGYHIDSGRDMTPWRDWVIDAFNRNMPFGQFTVEQLAGDLLPNPSLAQRVASGFNRNHMINFEGGAIPEEYLAAYVIDRVNTTGTVWLGLTIGCCQCHDHKFDPISQKEYYQFYAFFNNIRENGLDGRKGNATPKLEMPTTRQLRERTRLGRELAEAEQALAIPRPEIDALQASWETKALEASSSGGQAGARESSPAPANILAILKTPYDKRGEAARGRLRTYYRSSVSPELRPQYEQLDRLRASYEANERAIPSSMVMEELPDARETFILLRGQYDKPGERVKRGVPASLPPLPSDAPANRLGLARWLVDPGHPLTARVTVNRFWQMFFGTGLVKTAEDFGSQGERPSHPELLDWLAVEFREGWDVRALVRSIVTSATYRQSSVVTPELLAKDPENRLLSRGPRLRLQAEFVRDQALAIGGLLDRRIGGASVSPYQPAGLWEELASRLDGKNWTAQVYEQSHGRDLYRRTMYTFWKRTSPPPTLSAFDAPDRETCTVRRARTNTPLQALILMNDPTYVEASRRFAERIMTQSGPSVDDRIAFAFRLATVRRPTSDEGLVLRELFEAQLATYRSDVEAARKLLGVGESPRDETLDPAELAAWSMVANAILSLDETVTKG